MSSQLRSNRVDAEDSDNDFTSMQSTKRSKSKNPTKANHTTATVVSIVIAILVIVGVGSALYWYVLRPSKTDTQSKSSKPAKHTKPNTKSTGPILAGSSVAAPLEPVVELDNHNLPSVLPPKPTTEEASSRQMTQETTISTPTTTTTTTTTHKSSDDNKDNKDDNKKSWSKWFKNNLSMSKKKQE